MNTLNRVCSTLNKVGSYLSNLVVSKKRTRSEAELDDDESESSPERPLKRQKVRSSASEYIFETLFVNGTNSDVKISALGQTWNLHKMFLGQSGYFSSMFSGSWKESSMDEILIDIPDENVTVEALNLSFSSLYRDNIDINPAIVVNVLASALHLNLPDLIQQCADVMIENLGVKTACDYYTAAKLYGVEQVSKASIQYLQLALMPNVSVDLLKDITPELMLCLVKSSNLFVLQVELDVYSMLRKWLFLKLNKDWEGNLKKLVRDTDTFIKSDAICTAWSPSFLDTPEGAQYSAVFSRLRLQHIIADPESVTVLENDRIVPHDWLSKLYRQQWLYILKLDSSQDLGPENIDSKTFERESMRCGRTLLTEGQYCWRWTGFNYGIDILITCTNRRIVLKRNTNTTNCRGVVAPQPKRHIYYRLMVHSYRGEQEKPYILSTGIQHLILNRDEEVAVLTVDQKASFPLFISCSFLLYTPCGAIAKELETSDSSPAVASDSSLAVASASSAAVAFASSAAVVSASPAVIGQLQPESVEENVEESVEENVKESVDESVYESVDESVNESLYESVDERVNESVDESVNESVDENVDESVNESVNENVDESVNENVDENVDESVNENVDESVNENVDESVNESVDENLDESVNENVDESVNENVDENLDESVNENVDENLDESVNESVEESADN